MRILIVATFKFRGLNAGARERALTMMGIELNCITNDMNFFSDGTLCPVKEGPCYHSYFTEVVCVIDDEPYCYTHQCSPSAPCIVQGCPHCIGAQEIMSRGDQGNDSLGLSKPDPAVVGG